MRERASTFFLTSLVIIGIVLCGSISGAEERDPLIGTWALNTAKSTWTVRRPAKSIRRTFDYTIGGMMLVTYEILGMNDQWTYSHWYLTTDDAQQPEFTRSGGKAPIFHMWTKALDPYTKETREIRVGDPKQTVNTIIFTVSKDTKTMTMTYKNEAGMVTDTAVYDRVW